MSDELNLGNLKISQLGYVYKDIKKQATILVEKFGVKYKDLS